MTRPVVGAYAETCLYQVVLTHVILACSVAQTVARRGTVAELKLADDIVAELAAAQIAESDALSFRRFLQRLLKPIVCPLVAGEQLFAVLALLACFLVNAGLNDLYVVFAGQPSDGLWVGHVVDLHEEIDGVAALVAAKAMTDALGWRDDKRRGLLLVERTQSLVVDSRLA